MTAPTTQPTYYPGKTTAKLKALNAQLAAAKTALEAALKLYRDVDDSQESRGRGDEWSLTTAQIEAMDAAGNVAKEVYDLATSAMRQLA